MLCNYELHNVEIKVERGKKTFNPRPLSLFTWSSIKASNGVTTTVTP